jgi:hypothetical protein
MCYLRKILIENYAMGTIGSAKKERRRPEMSRPHFLPKGIVSLYKKLFSINPVRWRLRLCHGINPAPILESTQVSAPIGTANPTSQNRHGVFIPLQYTFDFELAKINTAEIF